MVSSSISDKRQANPKSAKSTSSCREKRSSGKKFGVRIPSGREKQEARAGAGGSGVRNLRQSNTEEAMAVQD